jgi:apolipoprotein N-acyltransferase
VREEDLEPHAGLRYIARLFKVLALLLLFMLVAEVIIGLRQDGASALGTLLVEATRLIVFAGFLWGAGDIALMLIESNHDLRATRILVGRLGAKVDRYFDEN